MKILFAKKIYIYILYKKTVSVKNKFSKKNKTKKKIKQKEKGE